MYSVFASLLTLACVTAAGLSARRLGEALPAAHLDDATRDLLKLLSRLVSTLIALVLGLLVGSTKTSYDEANDALRVAGANFVRLDRQLRLYGPEAAPQRALLREALASTLDRDWPHGEYDPGLFEGLELLHAGIARLAPTDTPREALRAGALAISDDLLRSRWLLAGPAEPPLPSVFLIGLIAWLVVLFAGFGLMTPRSPTAVAALLICGASISGAVFLILELGQPFDGLLRASSQPFEQALARLRP